jgi:hypothetical protein
MGELSGFSGMSGFSRIGKRNLPKPVHRMSPTANTPNLLKLRSLLLPLNPLVPLNPLLPDLFSLAMRWRPKHSPVGYALSDALRRLASPGRWQAVRF